MSIRPLHTVVIDCDFCDNVFSDVVEMKSELLETLAIRDGWQASENHQIHMCPKCVGKQRDEKRAAE